MSRKKAVFLDRDGTLNDDQGFVHKIEDFKLLPGVIEGLKLLQENFIFIIITNQPGLGLKLYTKEDFYNFNNYLITKLNVEGIKIEKTYFCQHKVEDKCDCRKPKTFFIEKCVIEFDIDLNASWVIGDHPSDVQLGINAGCNTVYLCTGHGSKHYPELSQKGISPTIISHDFLTAAEKIMTFSLSP